MGQIRGTGGMETDGTGNGREMVVGEAGESGEGEGAGKKKNRWWVPLRHNRGSTDEEVPIKFGTYNIRNGRNGGLEAALRGMAQSNIDLGVFQETKCTDGVHTRALDGYRVVATDAPSRHSAG